MDGKGEGRDRKKVFLTQNWWEYEASERVSRIRGRADMNSSIQKRAMTRPKLYLCIWFLVHCIYFEPWASRFIQSFTSPKYAQYQKSLYKLHLCWICELILHNTSEKAQHDDVFVLETVVQMFKIQSSGFELKFDTLLCHISPVPMLSNDKPSKQCKPQLWIIPTVHW